MNLLLLLFAFPIATIIYSVVLQKIIRCPILVALTIFASFLIVTFAAFDETFLIYTILYTIIAYITAIITRLAKNIFRRIIRNQNDDNESECCMTENVGNENDTNNGCCNERSIYDNYNWRRCRR
ncbi:MAG: DUF2651 family protein [Clostridia bacterium]|nr:DUF2651 family protein [Clostridia bacterium]